MPARRLRGLAAFVGIDDVLHQRMADDVGAGEARERDAAHAFQHLLRVDQPALLPAVEIDLRDVAGDHGLGAEADAREEHLHLLGRGVLRLVEDDERVVERAPAHVRERRDLDRVALEELRDLVEAHEVVQRVVERTQVRIDLLREVAGKEPEPLAGLDRGAHQHDALDRVALERVDRAGDGEIGLAGARRADAERDVVGLDVAQVLDLVRRAAVQVGASRLQDRLIVGAGDAIDAIGAVVRGGAIGARRAIVAIGAIVAIADAIIGSQIDLDPIDRRARRAVSVAADRVRAIRRDPAGSRRESDHGPHACGSARARAPRQRLPSQSRGW